MSHHKLHNLPFHTTSVTLIRTSDQVNINSMKQTIVASCAAFTWRLVRLGNTRPYVVGDWWTDSLKLHLHSIPGCTINTNSQKVRVYLHFLDVRNDILLYLRHLIILAFLLYEQWNNNFIFTCMNELEYENCSLFSLKWGVYELIGCLNYYKF